MALLYIDDDESPFAKVYGCGSGLPMISRDWFLDGCFGQSASKWRKDVKSASYASELNRVPTGDSVDVEECTKLRILLSLHVASLKPGVLLGSDYSLEVTLRRRA